MKRILDYLYNNAMAVLLGIGIGLALAYSTFFIALYVINHIVFKHS